MPRSATTYISPTASTLPFLQFTRAERKSKEATLLINSQVTPPRPRESTRRTIKRARTVSDPGNDRLGLHPLLLLHHEFLQLALVHPVRPRHLDK